MRRSPPLPPHILTPYPSPPPPQHKPWLLEVNSGPDLSLFGTRLRHLGLDMLRDLLQVLEAWP